MCNGILQGYKVQYDSLNQGKLIIFLIPVIPQALRKYIGLVSFIFPVEFVKEYHLNNKLGVLMLLNLYVD